MSSQYGQINPGYDLPFAKQNTKRRSTIYSPLNLRPIMWLDANDYTTIIHNANGEVSEWLDKTGNKYNAIQKDSTIQPVYIGGGGGGTGIISARTSAIRFTQDHLDIPNLILQTNELDVFIVANIQSTSNAWARLLTCRDDQFTNDFTNNTSLVWLVRNNTNAIFFTSQNQVDTPSFTGSYNRLYLINIQYSLTNIIMRVDANTDRSMDSPRPAINTTSGFRICQGFTNGADENWDGDVVHILIFPRLLSLTERQYVEGYLAWDARIQTLSLPTAHPFRNTRPTIAV